MSIFYVVILVVFFCITCVLRLKLHIIFQYTIVLTDIQVKLLPRLVTEEPYKYNWHDLKLSFKLLSTRKSRLVNKKYLYLVSWFRDKDVQGLQTGVCSINWRNIYKRGHILPLLLFQMDYPNSTSNWLNNIRFVNLVTDRVYPC